MAEIYFQNEDGEKVLLGNSFGEIVMVQRSPEHFPTFEISKLERRENASLCFEVELTEEGAEEIRRLVYEMPLSE